MFTRAQFDCTMRYSSTKSYEIIKTQIYSKGLLVSYTKICTLKTFPSIRYNNVSMYALYMYHYVDGYIAVVFTVTILVLSCSLPDSGGLYVANSGK